jgi:sec-independent protein translocase protein TatC
LRSRAITSLAAFVVCTLIVWNFLDPVIRYVVRPVGRIVFTSPEEAFGARMTLAMTGGFLFALPVILYQVWKFVALGLTENEKRHVKLFGPLSLVFFLCRSGFWFFCHDADVAQFLIEFFFHLDGADDHGG